MSDSTPTPSKADTAQAIAWAHDLWKTRDIGKPQAILDRNGEVVLALCKRCGKAESDLTAENCTPVEKYNPLAGPCNVAY